MKLRNHQVFCSRTLSHKVKVDRWRNELLTATFRPFLDSVSTVFFLVYLKSGEERMMLNDWVVCAGKHLSPLHLYHSISVSRCASTLGIILMNALKCATPFSSLLSSEGLIVFETFFSLLTNAAYDKGEIKAHWCSLKLLFSRTFASLVFCSFSPQNFEHFNASHPKL